MTDLNAMDDHKYETRTYKLKLSTEPDKAFGNNIYTRVLKEDSDTEYYTLKFGRLYNILFTDQFEDLNVYDYNAVVGCDSDSDNQLIVKNILVYYNKDTANKLVDSEPDVPVMNLKRRGFGGCMPAAAAAIVNNAVQLSSFNLDGKTYYTIPGIHHGSPLGDQIIPLYFSINSVAEAAIKYVILENCSDGTTLEMGYDRSKLEIIDEVRMRVPTDLTLYNGDTKLLTLSDIAEDGGSQQV